MTDDKNEIMEAGQIAGYWARWCFFCGCKHYQPGGPVSKRCEECRARVAWPTNFQPVDENEENHESEIIITNDTNQYWSFCFGCRHHRPSSDELGLGLEKLFGVELEKLLPHACKICNARVAPPTNFEPGKIWRETEG